MRTDKTPSLQSMTTRQKVTGVIFVIILIIVIWQLIGLFRGRSTAPTVPSTKPAHMVSGPTSPQLSKPSPTNLKTTAAPLSQREMELMQLQQQTEAKYIAAINELQMLKIQRDIAQTNQEIARAKLETVTAQQGIVQLLSPQPSTPATYARGLVNPVTGAPATPTPPQPTTPVAAAPAVQTEVSYSVISVSQLQSRWSAVLGYQGNLYSVFVGDVLPPDNSTVVAISKAGVVLQKDGARRKVSLVPII